MSKPPPSMPSGSGPQGPISDEMIAEHYIANYAEHDPHKAVVLLIRSNRSLTSELRSLKAARLEAATQQAIAAHIVDNAAETDELTDIEAAADMVIAACDGDPRVALKCTLVANAYLESELDRVAELVSPGFARGRLRPAG
jgi:replication-associated recombination protein RarA